MEYDNVPTEELLRIASETNTINPDSTPEIIVDYQNGKIIQRMLSIISEMELTQKDLAKRIGKSKQYVPRILNEKQNFTMSSLAVLQQPYIVIYQLLLYREKSEKRIKLGNE